LRALEGEPMKPAVEACKERLGSLEPGERAELALFLIGLLEPEEEGAEAAWDEVAGGAGGGDSRRHGDRARRRGILG
jgi:hypothetical protein